MKTKFKLYEISMYDIDWKSNKVKIIKARMLNINGKLLREPLPLTFSKWIGDLKRAIGDRRLSEFDRFLYSRIIKKEVKKNYLYLERSSRR